VVSPQWDEGDEAQNALRAIVSNPVYGVAALSSSQMMTNLLKDLLPDAPREISLRDSALTPLTGGKGFFVALSCGFLLDGWLAWCLIPHPMGAVTMAGGL